MSLFAGIYSLDNENSIDEEARKTIIDNISRHDDLVETYSDNRFFLAKLDVGAFQDPAFLKEKGKAVTALAGDPILNPPANQNKTRLDVLRELSHQFKSGDVSTLKKCQGTFTLCWYDASSADFLLATDKLGARPLYYCIDHGFLYFSGSLRLLETIGKIPKRMDLIGITEELALNAPLGCRTPYADIKVLRGGEYLKTVQSKVEISPYFQWDTIPRSKTGLDQLLNSAYKDFITAVESRAWRDNAVVSFLSGGLDSRCTVTALRLLGKQVFTGNLSFPGTQDAVYAEQYAKVLRLNHKSFPRFKHEQFAKLIFTNMMTKLISDLEGDKKYYLNYPRLIFSGDGGSVGLGHVYINEDIVSLMRERNIAEAVAIYMANKYLPSRLLQKDICSRLRLALYDEVTKELTSVSAHEPARNFYIFLLNNDQRRHLRDHFENIDQHRIEFLLPFYDGNFLETIVATPIDECLRHKFYAKWLDRFPDIIKSVPWQTYPGHVACPIKEDDNLSYQWGHDKAFRSKIFFDRCRRMVFQPRFAKKLLSRPYLLAALSLHSARIRNYSSEFKFGVTYQDYYSKCGGNIVL